RCKPLRLCQRHGSPKRERRPTTSSREHACRAAAEGPSCGCHEIPIVCRTREAIMVVLNKIYTRTGDDGTTALGTGDRRKQYDLRISAYGTLDELNSVIGIARLHTTGNPELHAALARIQNDLFDVGADLCMPGLTGKGPAGARLAVTETQVEWLEHEIDALTA